LCWTDFPWYRAIDSRGETEWGRALHLNTYLWSSRTIVPDDVVVADGFWALGLEHFPSVVSHSHGIWSHLLHEEALAGKQPDMPGHHAAQVRFRKRWRGDLHKPMTAVSHFIAEQLRLQWGLTVDRVIDNGVDVVEYAPMSPVVADWYGLRRPLVIHGVNDRANLNKGWDHIELLQRELDANVLSLDEAYHGQFIFRSDRPWTKPQVLAQADLVVHPSGFEGNSMFVAEAMACAVPVVGYDVGYLWWVARHGGDGVAIPILSRSWRSPEFTLQACRSVLNMSRESREGIGARLRGLAPTYERFRSEWRSYVEELENGP